MTDAATLIRAKRDGRRLADDDIRWLFEAYARARSRTSRCPRC